MELNDIWTCERTLASLPMPPPRIRSIGALVSVVLLSGCERAAAPPPPLFRRLTPAQTGGTFANTITTSDSLNARTDPYIYNGAGVAEGGAHNNAPPARISSR